MQALQPLLQPPLLRSLPTALPLWSRLLLLPLVLLGRPVAASPEAAASETAADRAFAQADRDLKARAGKPEAVAALGAVVALQEDVAPGRLIEVLRALVADRRTDPLVAAQAENQLALAEARAGDRDAAEARFAALGLVTRFQVIGPFDAQGRGGLARPYPPEEAGGGPGQGGPVPGKERDVVWRDAHQVSRQGALALDGLLRPDSDAVAYALTYVRSPRGRRAVLRIGSPGPVRVWIGGRIVLDRSVIRDPRFDQDAATVDLPAGESAVLVKSVVLEGPWRLFLRFTDEQGKPLRDLEARATGTAPLVAQARPRSLPPARELGSVLRARADRAKGAAVGDAWLDYGRWLALSRAADRESKEIERALGRAADAGAGAPAWLLLADRAEEDEDRRRALERALAIAKDPGDRALALSGLAELAQTHHRDDTAIALWRQALTADPLCVRASIALGAEEQIAGLASSALARLDALPPPVRALPRVQAARARVLETLGRTHEADEALRAAFAGRRTDVDLLLDLARNARNRGDADEAIRLQAEAAHQRPEMTFATTAWSHLLEGRGETDEARAVLQAAVERLPDDAGLREDLGRLLVRLGQTKAGVEELRQALVLRPQNPTLRRYVTRLAAETGGAGDPDDLARSWAEDGAALVATKASAAAQAAEADAGTVVLLDKQVVRVHRNGLAERFAQRLVEVRTEQAAREQLEFFVRYTPGTQEVEIRRARIHRRNERGELEVLQASGRDDRDLSEPWYGLYYDVRAEVVLFEGLRPGDVLEVQYTVADVSSENSLAGYFGDMDFIGESAPRRRWEYVLLGPPERAFYFNQPRVAGFEHKQETRSGQVVHTFRAQDVPRVISEPGMPGWAEVTPYLHVSTYQSWAAVGRWYWDLIEDQLTPDDDFRRAAHAAVGNAHTTEEKVRAIHRFVLDSTRYVGLEFGIHGFKPYKVTQVLTRRFGDCKDKASLMLALLREVGIDSDLVLLRTRRSGRVPDGPASLAVFDHAIVYVPSLSLYLDGTAEFSGMAELPAEDQGATALRVNARGATLVETPVLPAASNQVQRRWQATLDPDGAGGARVAEEITVSGQAAPEWREYYQTPGERRDRFTKVWNGRFPAASLEELKLDGVEDRNRPVTARSVALVPRLAEPAGPANLRVPISSREPDFVRTYARLSQRRQEYVLAYPWRHEEDLRFRLPDGWHVSELPRGGEGESVFGRYRLEIVSEKEGHEVAVHSTVDVTKNRIAAADYPAFRSFLGALDGTLRQWIVLEKDEP